MRQVYLCLAVLGIFVSIVAAQTNDAILGNPGTFATST